MSRNQNPYKLVAAWKMGVKSAAFMGAIIECGAEISKSSRRLLSGLPGWGAGTTSRGAGLSNV
jgi:hypothetical protein